MGYTSTKKITDKNTLTYTIDNINTNTTATGNMSLYVYADILDASSYSYIGSIDMSNILDLESSGSSFNQALYKIIYTNNPSTTYTSTQVLAGVQNYWLDENSKLSYEVSPIPNSSTLYIAPNTYLIKYKGDVDNQLSLGGNDWVLSGPLQCTDGGGTSRGPYSYEKGIFILNHDDSLDSKYQCYFNAKKNGKWLFLNSNDSAADREKWYYKNSAEGNIEKLIPMRAEDVNYFLNPDDTSPQYYYFAFTHQILSISLVPENSNCSSWKVIVIYMNGGDWGSFTYTGVTDWRYAYRRTSGNYSPQGLRAQVNLQTLSFTPPTS